jgi:hypothetical protein
MRFSHLFETTTGLTLVVLALIAPPTAPAQTIISNEALVSTTFVVNKTSETAKCGKPGCQAITSMFAAIPVLCPAPMGKTCTFHIFLGFPQTRERPVEWTPKLRHTLLVPVRFLLFTGRRRCSLLLSIPQLV